MAVVPPLIEAYQPDLVLTQLGVDTFREDPLAHVQLTTAGFTYVLRQIKSLAPRWIATGGGGYHLPNVARAWTLAWGIMNDIEVPDRLPDAALVSLRQEGYRDRTLRDPEVSWHPSHRERMRAGVQQAVASLKQHIFPLHGLEI
jgi:acetoin utilization protein AcuC